MVLRIPLRTYRSAPLPPPMEGLPPLKMVSPTPSSLDSSSTASSRLSPAELVPSKEGAFVNVQRDAEAIPAAVAPPDFPEGGLRAWLTVFGG